MNPKDKPNPLKPTKFDGAPLEDFLFGFCLTLLIIGFASAVIMFVFHIP